jgi:AcrR family transcriptional regulator
MSSMSDDDATGRRRLDPDARRAAILAAAARAFARGPYDRVSVADVAREAGVSEALVFRYFNGKPALFTEVVQAHVDELEQLQQAAVGSLPAGVPARERVRASLQVLLDHVAAHPDAWAAPLVGGGYPAPALEVRHAHAQRLADGLRTWLATSSWVRHEYAIWAYVGAIEGACLAWVRRGCPPDERGPLIEALLGTLQGGLGDWGR